MRGEAGSPGDARSDSIGAEDAPVVAVEVPRDEIPTPVPRYEVVGLHPARWRSRGGIAGFRWGCVVEAQHFAGFDGSAERREHAGVDVRVRPGRGPVDGGDLEGVDTVAQACGHDLPD